MLFLGLHFLKQRACKGHFLYAMHCGICFRLLKIFFFCYTQYIYDVANTMADTFY